MVNIISSSRYKVHRKVVIQHAQNVLNGLGIDPSMAINIVFVGARKMKEVANTYKHENFALPVLAFPYKGDETIGKQLFGEVILCYPEVVLLAAERNKKLDDMINQLVEHGIQNLLK